MDEAEVFNYYGKQQVIESVFDIDFIIDKAAGYGIYAALHPTWGDKFNLVWGKGPVIFNQENAYTYGKWIGNRDKDRNNIIWVLGGDCCNPALKMAE